ncbi:hypothetical protein E2P81_ATG01545 [Venturia nashicola]|nr:hypothetical protein E2P81_ATG01545 [Venturia nashicola]
MNALVAHVSQKLSVTYSKLYAFLDNIASAKLSRTWIQDSIMTLNIINHAPAVPESIALPTSPTDVAPPPYSELDVSSEKPVETLCGPKSNDETTAENSSSSNFNSDVSSEKPEESSPTPLPAEASLLDPSLDTSAENLSECSPKSLLVGLVTTERPFSDHSPETSSKQISESSFESSEIGPPSSGSRAETSAEEILVHSLEPLPNHTTPSKISSAVDAPSSAVIAPSSEPKDISPKGFPETLPGRLPIDVTMAALSPPMSPDRSPMRHVPSPIDTCMSSLRPTPRESLIDSPWPLTPLAPGATAVPSLEGGVPFPPMDEVNAMTLDAVFRQLAVHRPYNVGMSKPCLPGRNPQRIQTNNQPRLSVRFDDMATPTTAIPLQHSAVSFSPCTPQAMFFTAPWIDSQHPAIGEETAESCAAGTKSHKPSFDELTTPVCRAYYFEPHKFAGRMEQNSTPTTYNDDAPLLALQSDSQDSVILYDRVGERMTDVSTLDVPGWTKDGGETGLSVEQEAPKTPSSAHFGVAPPADN